MNNIDTTQVTDPTSLQPFTTKSLAFLQNANLEMIKGICTSIMGDTQFATSSTLGVAIAGCTYNGAGTTIFNGFIMYANELYYFAGQASLNTFVNVPVVVADTTNDGTADPVDFSDGVSKNVHKVRRLKVVDQLTGTGLFDLSTMINIKTYTGTALSLGAGWTTYSSRTVKYRKDGFNMLTIKGAIQYTWAGSPQLTIGTLPSGYRPVEIKQFVAQVYNSTTSGWSACDIQISTAGVISYGQHVNHAVSDVIYVFLDNINIYLSW